LAAEVNRYPKKPTLLLLQFKRPGESDLMKRVTVSFHVSRTTALILPLNTGIKASQNPMKTPSVYAVPGYKTILLSYGISLAQYLLVESLPWFSCLFH